MKLVTLFIRDLREALPVYLKTALLAPLLVFVAVEGWRGLTWLVETQADRGIPSTGAGNLLDLIVFGAWAAVAIVVVTGNARGHRSWVATYAALAVVQVVALTGGLYGLLAAIRNLAPNIVRIDLLTATSLATTLILAATLILRRRVNH